MIKIKNKKAEYAVSIILLSVGTFFMAIGFSFFLAPIQIAPGGFSGIAALVVYAFSDANIPMLPVGMLTLLLNVPLYWFSIRRLGKRFAVLSITGVISYAVFIDLTSILQSTPAVYGYLKDIYSEKLLCVLYGGVITGVGLGVVLRAGGSTGGSDMLAIVVNERKPTVSMGSVIMAVNVTVVLMSIFIYDIIPALYALICIILSSFVVDYVLEGIRAAKAYYIISEKSEEISQRILHKVHRGVTALKAQGMYTKHDKNVLMCIVTRTQVAELRRIVRDIDPKAFMFSTSVKEVIGEGFAKTQRESTPPKEKKMQG